LFLNLDALALFAQLTRTQVDLEGSKSHYPGRSRFEGHRYNAIALQESSIGADAAKRQIRSHANELKRETFPVKKESRR
jgi:hypothetical protein